MSDGFPLMWYITNNSKTYVDFGIPTFTGFSNMLRAFILANCYLICYHSALSLKNYLAYLIIGLFLILSPFILELCRGNGIALILQPLGLYFLLNNFRFRDVKKVFLFAFIFIFFFAILQCIRYSKGFDSLYEYAFSAGFTDINKFTVFLIPSLMYIVMPIINLDLNLASAPLFKFNPYYTLQGFVPTILRNKIYEEKDYGDLLNEANNVSTYYIPLIRDFGFIGTLIIVFLISIIVSYFFSKAKCGKLFFILSYPPLFMSLALSFFSLYFTSLVVLFYPILVLIFLNKYKTSSV